MKPGARMLTRIAGAKTVADNTEELEPESLEEILEGEPPVSGVSGVSTAPKVEALVWLMKTRAG